MKYQAIAAIHNRRWCFWVTARRQMVKIHQRFVTSVSPETPGNFKHLMPRSHPEAADSNPSLFSNILQWTAVKEGERIFI
jgi:hypothetical protein